MRPDNCTHTALLYIHTIQFHTHSLIHSHLRLEIMHICLSLDTLNAHNGILLNSKSKKVLQSAVMWTSHQSIVLTE